MFDNASVIWLANYSINMGEAYETKMHKCLGYNRDDLQCAGYDYELDYLLWAAGHIILRISKIPSVFTSAPKD